MLAFVMVRKHLLRLAPIHSFYIIPIYMLLLLLAFSILSTKESS
jgi:hypothetical protein